MAQPLHLVESIPIPIETSVPQPDMALTAHDLWLLTHTHTEKQWNTYDADGPRTHQFQQIELPGRKHRRLRTEASPDVPAEEYEVVNLLGWTESVDTALTQKTHEKLSGYIPGAAINTEATYGIDGTVEGNWPKIRGLNLDDMAARTFDMLRTVYADKPLVITATSMNAAVLARVEELNDNSDQQVNIVQRILYEPCLVPPERAGLRMAPGFFAHVIKDYMHELVYRTAPSEIFEIILDEAKSGPRLRDIPAVLAQGLSLLRGTPYDLIATLARKEPIKIQGTTDCLGSDIVNSLPFKHRNVEGKGHGMAMNPRKRAYAIAKALQSMASVG